MRVGEGLCLLDDLYVACVDTNQLFVFGIQAISKSPLLGLPFKMLPRIHCVMSRAETDIYTDKST